MAVKHAVREARERLLGRVRVQRAQAARDGPVLSAWRRSNASAPRTSPTRIRSGRWRKRGAQEFGDGDGGNWRFLSEWHLRTPSLETHQVRLVDHDL